MATKTINGQALEVTANLAKETPKKFRYDLDDEADPRVGGSLYVSKTAIKGEPPSTVKVSLRFGK